MTACGPDEETTPTYRLTSILPSPVTPGETVTAYGQLPQKPLLTLNGVTLEATSIPGGIRFNVPADFVAGSHALRVSEGKFLASGLVQILPRLDQVALQGNTLSASGAGWPSTGTLSEVWLEVDGQRYPVTQTQAQPPRLQSTLPQNPVYGVSQVRLVVGSEASTPQNLFREAGAVQGRVELPANAAMASGDVQSSSEQSLVTTSMQDRKVLLVQHQANAFQQSFSTLEGFQSSQTIPQLGISRLVFVSDAQAEKARATLLNMPNITRVDFEPLAQVQGSESIAMPAPASRIYQQSVSSQAAPNIPLEQWHLPLMGMTAAWATSQGEGVVVAVVDTGVLLGHPDLQANLLPGWDFTNDSPSPNDTYGHGTHVAGLVAANGAALGTAPKAKILPVRVMERFGSSFKVAQGILWAAGLSNNATCTSAISQGSATPSAVCNPTPARVINLSLGVEGAGASPIEQAVRQALDAGIVVVAASGNSGGGLATPASVNGVVSVTSAAGPSTLYQPWYANTGVGLQLTAFGGDTTQDQDRNGQMDGIYSTDRASDGRPGYGLRMGTSMASPLVAGLAALLIAEGHSTSQTVDLLTHNTTDLGVMGYDLRYGYGLASGRSLSRSNPRLYVVALHTQGNSQTVLGWSLVQHDLSFTLSNLPPGQPLTLVVAGDLDNNGKLGEAGELISSPLPFTPTASTLRSLSEPLRPTVGDGSRAFLLRQP